jgi:hypothetical protein
LPCQDLQMPRNHFGNRRLLHLRLGLLNLVRRSSDLASELQLWDSKRTLPYARRPDPAASTREASRRLDQSPYELTPLVADPSPAED